MMKQLLLPALLCLGLWSAAQKEPNTKFGKISPEDLQKTAYAIDSSAPAVVLYDMGETELVGNQKGWFSMRFKHRKRTHILNKNGYGHADVVIPLYKDGSNEARLDNLKAVTYNLEGSKIVETKLERSALFKEQVDKNHIRAKFTFPNVKEGSVIEYEYEILSDYYFNLMPWEFQGSAPRLWSEYRFSLPQFMNYMFLAQGYFPFHIKEQKDRRSAFTLIENNTSSRTERYTFTCNVTDYRWVMKDVPELKQERFTSTLDNHVAKIQFQLSGYQDPLTPRQIMNTWPQVIQSLLERDDFGKPINAANNWLSDVSDDLIKGSGEEEKAKRIFAYVRDHFSCTGYNSYIADQTLRNVVKTGKGTVSEINLLLIALLRQAKIKADPVILSTREHGYVNAYYPIMDKYNYLICQAIVNGKTVFLDASQAQLGYNRLDADCYNGPAQVVREMGPQIDLNPDSLFERKVTSLFMRNAGGKWEGRMTQNPGYYESFQLRRKIKSSGQKEFFDGIAKGFGADVTIQNPQVDSLQNYETPLALRYDFNLSNDGEDIVYMNPLFGEGYKENPFKSAERYYPVEMPYCMDETYTMTMEVPEDYVVEELPKQIRLKLNEEGDGSFEYLISQSGNTISMRSRIQLKRTYYLPDEYEMLREFFNLIVSKHSEQIVLKKKK